MVSFEIDVRRETNAIGLSSSNGFDTESEAVLLFVEVEVFFALSVFCCRLLLVSLSVPVSSSRGKPNPRPSDKASTTANEVAMLTYKTLLRLAFGVPEAGRASAVPSSIEFMFIIVVAIVDIVIMVLG